MPILLVVFLLITGLVIGFLSGLLGIGGGIIMTPVQYWLLSSSGVSSDLAIKISLATTLAVILPTAASGVWQHQRQGGINWKAAVFMGIFTAIGSFFGAGISARLPGSTLKLLFGILALVIATRMVTVTISEDERPIRDNRWLWFALALPIGIVTGILGLGGGILVIPLLILVLRFSLRNAVGTSLAMMLFTSTGGIIGYVINRPPPAESLPPFQIGYINWVAWIALTLTSIGMAQVGAVMAHRWSGRLLNYLFVALLFFIGLNMLGVFNWIYSHF